MNQSISAKLKRLSASLRPNKLDKHALAFHYDCKASYEGVSGLKPVFPGSRQKYIELVEEAELQGAADQIEGDIKCQHLHWEYKCPMYWENLTPTSFDDVRHCNTCDKNVYTAYTRKQLKKLVDDGLCVRVITKEEPRALIGVLNVPDDYEETVEPKHYNDPAALYLIDEIAGQLSSIQTRKNKLVKYELARKAPELLFALNSEIQKLEERLPRLLERLTQQVAVGLRDRETLLPSDYDLSQLTNEQHERIAQVAKYWQQVMQSSDSI